MIEIPIKSKFKEISCHIVRVKMEVYGIFCHIVRVVHNEKVCKMPINSNFHLKIQKILPTQLPHLKQNPPTILTIWQGEEIENT